MGKREANLLESRGEARPVKGRIIRPDFTTPLNYAIAGFAIMFLAFAFIALGVKSGNHLITARAVAIGIQGVLICGGGILVAVAIVLRNRRLIVGEDRLQLVGGLGQVLGQLPYDNILEAKFTPYCGLGIVLVRMKRRDTWWTRWSERKEWSVEIRPSLESDATALKLALTDALRDYRHRYGDKPWQVGRL